MPKGIVRRRMEGKTGIMQKLPNHEGWSIQFPNLGYYEEVSERGGKKLLTGKLTRARIDKIKAYESSTLFQRDDTYRLVKGLRSIVNDRYAPYMTHNEKYRFECVLNEIKDDFILQRKVNEYYQENENLFENIFAFYEDVNYETDEYTQLENMETVLSGLEKIVYGV